MDFTVLERLFPQQQSGGYNRNLSLEHTITIGGAPIGECLAAMMQLIRSQQQTIEDLQSQIQSQSSDQVQRVDRLERYVTVMTRDLKLDSRPIPAYGQGPMPTLSDALTTVEYRLTQVENKRRQTLLRQVLQIANISRYRNSFVQWSLVARAKGMMRDLCVGQSKRTRQVYYRKWMRYMQASKADQVNKRRVRALSYLSTKNIVQRYFDKWRRCRDLGVEDRVRMRLEASMKVEGMGGVSMRGVARRYFGKWAGFVMECRTMQYRVKQVLTMETTGSRRLVARYLSTWMNYVKLVEQLRHRLKVVDLQSGKAFRALAVRYIEKWQLCARRRILRRQTRGVVPRMHHMHLIALARRYFGKMEQFSRFSAERREKEAMQLALQQLARRCDALGAQLDLGLQTLSHTNGVLSKVLEHVSFNSSWERKRQSSQSPPRAGEALPSVPSPGESRVQPSAAAQKSSAKAAQSALRGDWGAFEDEWAATPPNLTADELLLQLRSRLQKINEHA